MTLISAFILLFICRMAACSMSPLCETVCHCVDDVEENLVALDCSSAYLRSILPVSDWPANITHMDMGSNNLTALETELAHSSLRVLDLSHNRIRKIVQNAFGGLRSLKYLNLANNDIREFQDDGFYGLDQLKSLNVSSNGLHSLPDNLFYRFIGLQELSLADNPIVHLDPNHFNKMISLRWLDLSHIDAYDLDTKLFFNTGQLDFLDLSGNQFVDVPTNALRSAKRLKHVRLNENPIGSLTSKSFAGLETLDTLELSFMDKLKRVEEETFSELSGLRVLEMRYNRQLGFISPTAFDGLFNRTTRPTLEELDLEGNQLSSLDQSMVPCAKLSKFNVQQNPWNCDCMFRWIKDCEIQKIYTAELKCSSPSRLAGYLIMYMKNEDLRCDYMESEIAREQIHHDHVVRSVSLGLGITVLVLLSFAVALVFKWRDIKEWYRKSRKGPGAVYYVRARANPREI